MDFLLKNFLLIYLLTLFGVSIETQLYDDNNVLFEFMKDPSNFEKFCAEKGFNDSNMNKFLMQKYEAHLGVLYELRKLWHCANIEEEFEAYDRTKCQKFRKYLDILHEFLFRVYAGLPAVKPMFYFDKIFTFCQMTEMISTLSSIWQFFSNSEVSEKRGHKLERFFVKYYEPKLFNEEKLNYSATFEEKETHEGIIVKIAQEFAWEKETNLKIFRLKFGEMLKRFNQLVKGKVQGNEMKYPLNFIGLSTRRLEWAWQAEDYLVEERAFAEFVRGPSYFEQFCNELENDDEAERINDYEFRRINRNNRDYDLSIVNSPTRYETVLGLLYLMRQNWNCAKIVVARNEVEERKLCERIGNYLNSLYEYLFTVYAKTEYPELAKEMPIVKPWFLPYVSAQTISNPTKVIEVMRTFSYISMELSERLTNKYYFYKSNLLNEDKLSNHKASFGNLNQTLRAKFDKKLQTMFKKTREEEKSNLNLNLENQALIVFVKGKSNFNNFCEEKKERLQQICATKYIFDQLNEHFWQKYAALFGVVYLMRENWYCAKIVNENAGQNRADSEGTIKTEDLFEMNPNPLLLIRKIEKFGAIIDVVKYFNQISKFYFDSKFANDKKYELENVLTNNSLNNFEQIFKLAKQNEEISLDKKPFDEKLKELFEIANEKALKERAEIQENYLFESYKSAAFEDKFGILFDSPFYDFGSKEKNLKVKGKGKEKTEINK